MNTWALPSGSSRKMIQYSCISTFHQYVLDHCSKNFSLPSNYKIKRSKGILSMVAIHTLYSVSDRLDLQPFDPQSINGSFLSPPVISADIMRSGS